MLGVCIGSMICDDKKKLPDVFNSFHFTDDYWRAVHELAFTKYISSYLKITVGSKVDIPLKNSSFLTVIFYTSSIEQNTYHKFSSKVG